MRDSYREELDDIARRVDERTQLPTAVFPGAA